MAKLGSLYYELFLKDLTDQDLQAIENKLKNLGIELDTKKLTESLKKSVESYKGKDLAVGVKSQYLHDAIRSALKQPEFPIKITVNKAEAQDAVREALRRAGLQQGFTASDKRQYDAETKRLAAMQVAQARAAASNALAQQRLARAHNTASLAASGHTKATVSLNSALRGNLTITKELGGAIGAAYSVVALKNFMTKVVEIGGELEQQKLAMKAILGDEGMANTISSQINTLAVKSPFGVMELNQYAKQLTAFQIPYNELYDTMKRMADVSAAVGVDMGRIILAYGQVRAAKFLKGTELRQFTEANIPLIDMLAERFTKLKGEIVSAGDIMDMISKKEISFEDVKAVLWELTGEGGRFYNMQEVLSESVKAKWKNLADAIDLMFADIAKETSGPLKNLAEMLTALTGNWETLATAIASGAIVFGAAKVYLSVFARALDASGKSALEAAANAALLERRNISLAKEYRELAPIEYRTLLTRLNFWRTQKTMLASLSAEQFENFAASKQLSKEEWSRLIALDRLNIRQKGILDNLGILTKEEQDNIKVLGKWRGAWLGVGNAMRSVGRSMLALVANPVTAIMAAVGTLMALWQRHSEAMKKAEEIGNELFTKAIEGASNLKQALGKIKPAEGLSDIDLTQGIEKMEQAIKDYSPTPIKEINEALTTQDGHLLTLAERYEALRKKLGEIKDAFDGIQFNKVNKAIENALGDTKEGWFFDGLEKNLKDYENAKSILDKHIRDYTVGHKEDIHGIVENASRQSEAYRKAIQNMSTDAQKFHELIFNGGRYGKEVDVNLNNIINRATQAGFWQNAGEGITNIDLRGTGQRVNAAYEELIADAKKFKERFNIALSEIGIDPKNVTPEQLSIALNSMLDKFEVGEDTKMMFAKKLEELYNITLIDDKVTPIFTEKFREIANASSNEAVQEAMIVWQTQGWSKLSAAQKKFLEDIFEQAKTQSKGSVEAIVGDMNTYLAAHPGQWNVVINMVTRQMQKEMPDWTRNAIFSRGGVFKGSKAAFGYLKTWGEDGSQYGARNAAQQALQDAENELKAYVSEADKLTPAYQKAVQKKADIQEAINYLGWEDIQTKDQESNKHSKGSQKDPLAESLKQRFNILKKAYGEYKKELALMSKDAALAKIKDAGIFDELFTGKDAITDFDSYEATLEKLLTDAESSLKGLSEKDNRFKGRHDLVISLRALLNLEIPRDRAKEALDKAKREIDALVSETTKKWDFYKAIFAQTGDKEASMRIAFGENIAWTDATQQLQDDLNKRLREKNLEVSLSLSYEEAKEKLKGTELYDLWKKVKDAIEKDGIDLRVDLAKAVYEASSIADKIKAQEGLRNAYETELRTKLPNITEIEVEAALKPYNDKIEELKSSMLELLPIWEQIFGDHQYQSYGQIQAAADIAKQIIDNAKIKKDANGKPVSFTSVYTDAEGNKQQIMGKISQLEKLRKAIQDLYKEGLKKNPFVTLWESLKKVFNGNWKDKNITEKLALIGESAAESAALVGNLAGQLANMFDAMGNDSMGQAMTDVQDVMNTVSNIGKGFAQGGIVGGVAAAAGEAIGWVTKLFQRHDAKLQKVIERSKEAAQIMQNQYDIIEKRMANFLGNAANMKVEGYGGDGGAYGKQLDLMKGQLAELEKQRQAEIDKKKTDNSVVNDYNRQIEEMKISIRDFAEEAAKDIYGIDLNGWASQIGDALVDAFAKGEDAAEAFDRAVADIMRSVVKSIIATEVIAPAMEKLRDYLFGDNGVFANYKTGGDFRLSAQDAAGLADRLKSMKGSVEDAKDIYDYINELSGGMLDETDKAKSGLSAGIQSVTEDTADLLASYVNATRASTAMIEQYELSSNEYLRMALEESFPRISAIAESQLRTQEQIAANTLLNAKMATEIRDILRRNIQGGGDFRIS